MKVKLSLALEEKKAFKFVISHCTQQIAYFYKPMFHASLSGQLAAHFKILTDLVG